MVMPNSNWSVGDVAEVTKFLGRHEELGLEVYEVLFDRGGEDGDDEYVAFEDQICAINLMVK